MQRTVPSLFGGFEKTEIFVPADNKRHPCNLDPNSSAFAFDKPKSLTKSFDYDTIRYDTIEEINGEFWLCYEMRCIRHTWFKIWIGTLPVPIAASSSFSSKRQFFGGFGTGRLSSCATGLIADSRLSVTSSLFTSSRQQKNTHL